MSFAEKHYTVPELAKLWHLSVGTIRAWFRDEPGVLRFGRESVRRDVKNYVSVRIPAHVAERVYARRGGNREKAS